MPSWIAALAAGVLLPAAAVGSTSSPSLASANRTGLVAISPANPWTLRDLERSHAAIVGHDPETGVSWAIASADEERRLVELGFTVSTVDPDIDKGPTNTFGPLDLGLYHTYDETVTDLQALQAQYPALCKLESIGQSLEGREIWALKISDDPETDDATEPDVLIVGCHHAREFMSVEVPLDWAHQLLEGYGISRARTAVVKNRETWIVPMLNVDGHVFQQHFQAGPDWSPPGWRKNRRMNQDGTYGVDLNRNYGYNWGWDNEGSSAEGLDETFRGATPFSEPETDVMRRFAERQDFVLSLSYHSFGRLCLYPWGYTRGELCADQPLFAALADSMVRSNGYRPGNAYFGTIYLTNGEFCDWMYGAVTPNKPHRTLAFTIELNGDGQGFWPAESLIEPTCEIMRPLNLYVLEAAGNPRTPLGPPMPVVTASQDPSDGRRIHLEWRNASDTGNPVVRYEVFEVAFSSAVQQAAAGVSLTASGRALLASGLTRPATGRVVLDVDADLEPLWDYAYIEARPAGGEWHPLAGRATRDLSPTGRNAGHGLTGPVASQRLEFDLGSAVPAKFDLAVRLDAVANGPRAARLRAALDVAATYSEERRVLDPDAHSPYDLIADHPGIVAFGVTAVDAEGQKTDSDIHYFVIPTVAVEISDIHLATTASGLGLDWHVASDGPARFEAWARRIDAGARLGAAAAEWSRGDYIRVATLDAIEGRAQHLEWDAAAGNWAVLLRGIDADGDRLWGPLQAAVRLATRLGPPVPNPFNPTGSFELVMANLGHAEVEVFAPNGRAVRRLAAGAFEAGPHRLTWDGRDDAGRPVASGVYLVRLRAGATVQTRRVALLK